MICFIRPVLHLQDRIHQSGEASNHAWPSKFQNFDRYSRLYYSLRGLRSGYSIIDTYAHVLDVARNSLFVERRFPRHTLSQPICTDNLSLKNAENMQPECVSATQDVRSTVPSSRIMEHAEGCHFHLPSPPNASRFYRPAMPPPPPIIVAFCSWNRRPSRSELFSCLSTQRMTQFSSLDPRDLLEKSLIQSSKHRCTIFEYICRESRLFRTSTAR